jgi:RNA polymerase sigma-70 factor (ECF subfamily)
MQAAQRVMTLSQRGSEKNAVEDHKRLMALVAFDQDREAFRLLFMHFGPRVKAMLLRSGADSATAEDLAQDVMVTVWRKSGQYTAQRGAVSTWIFTIARNARIDKLRRGSSQPHEDIDNMELESGQVDAEQEVWEGQRAGLVSLALTTLPDEQRQIMEMAFVRDLPQSEIARLLALPIGTVKSRMRLAYGKLREKLKEVR